MNAADHLSPQQFYRAHRTGEEFSADDAWSAPVDGDSDEQRGYSSFASAPDLHNYITSNQYPELTRDAPNTEVLRFSGDRVGTGVDNEPLVVPHRDEPDERMTWSSFTKSLGKSATSQGREAGS